MIYLRKKQSTRPDDWAHLFSIQYDIEGRDLWVVEFPDGVRDVWPSWDSQAGYDVRVQVEHPGVSDDQELQASSNVRDAARSLLYGKQTAR